MTAPLRVTVLGSSGTYAGVDNPCTGLLVRSAGASVMLDCGPGTLGPLQREIDPSELSAVVLSHCHPDHWLELPVLRNVVTWFRPIERLPVYGTARTFEMDKAITVPNDYARDPIEWTVIDSSSTLRIGDQDWSFSQTDHSVETLASRVDVGGRSFAFSSDSAHGWSVGELGPGIDFAICEASMLSSHDNADVPHSTARHTGSSAREAGVARLAITHIPPGFDRQAHLREAAEAFGGDVALALPGTTFDI